MKSEKVHILHTNDIHSHFGQMPFIAGGIRKLQSEFLEKGEKSVVVDLGDHADRMSSITEGTWGRANVEIMNLSGYRYAAVGNNEGLTFPKDRLLSYYDNAQFTVICSNLLDATTKQNPPFMKPYIIDHLGSMKVCWISVTANYPVYHELGWQVLIPNIQIEKIVKKIRSHVDLIIILSHTGYKNDMILANEVSGIDLIIGAHTHDLLESGVNVNNTFIIQAGKFGQYLGQTTIEFDPETKRVIKISGKCHDVQQFPKASDVEGLIMESQKLADQVLGPSIVSLEQEFPVDWYSESPLGSLLAEGIRDWVDAEIAMVNAGQLLFSLPKGPVTRKDLLALCPHPINPCKLDIKGIHIQAILEEALTEISIHRQVRGLGFRGKVMGWMCVDGMTVTYDREREEGNRILEILVNNKPLEPDRIYRVGTIDMFTFGWIFPQFREAERIQYFLPEFIRDVLSKELASKDARKRSRKVRWIQS